MGKLRDDRRVDSGGRAAFFLLVSMSLLFVCFHAGNLHAADKLPRVKLSVKPLDLSGPVSRESLMAAGQLGGQLYPTHEIPDRKKEQQINRSFGEAIEAWNRHEYKKAIGLFRKHIVAFPDSPWEAEATLHIGCDAQYTGRFSEAEECFTSIRKKYVGKEFDGAKRLVSKATLRLAVLKVSQNNFDEAGKLFTELHKTGSDWRERTYASHWIQRLSMYKRDKLAMLNCGTLALASVLEKNGNDKAAREVRGIVPSSLSGHSMQELADLAAGYGYRFQGVRVSDGEMERLPLPAIVRIGARNQGDSGHYWVLEKVAADDLVLFDPQAGRRYEQTVTEFAKEWDGIVMTLQAEGKPPGPGVRLSRSEQASFFGGCCGVPRPPENLGKPDPCDNAGPGSSCSNCSSRGAPTWSVNMVNMNLFATDTPLWYENPIGPPVEITLSYNSQSSIAYSQPFGNKWQLNYGSYLVVDTGGQVTIFMSDGRNDVYSPNGAGGYTKPFGVFNTLTRLAANHFTLKFPDDTVYEYAIPAGTTSLQPFLVKISDRYGQSLTFSYDTSVQLTTITDALQQQTHLTYINGLVDKVTDPFGREAKFEYDASGNLSKITDMGGHWSSLTYDSDVYLTSVGNSRGTWQFYIEPADGMLANFDDYSPPGDKMYENYRITITNPLNGKEEYFYFGGCDFYTGYGCGRHSWYVSPKNYVSWRSREVNNFRTNPLKKWYFFTTVPNGNGKGKISKIINEDGGTTNFTYDTATGRRASVTDANTHKTEYTHNSMGRVTSIKDAKLKTTNMTYEANNVDLKQISNGLGTVNMTYDGFHNVALLTNRLEKSTQYHYNGFGQKDWEKDALEILTTYTYYEASHPSRHRLKEIKRDNVTLYSLTYDSKGRVETRTDPTGLMLGFSYNNLDKITGIAYPDGKNETFNYSPCCPGLLDSYTDRANRTTYYYYDDLRRLIRVKEPDGTLIKYEYDSDGNLEKLIDPNNVPTIFAYDSMRRLVKKTHADGKYETYTYDGVGLLKTRANARDTAAARITATYLYDENDNLKTITYNDGTPNVGYTYDDYNRVATRTDGIGAWVFNFDAESQLKSIDGPWVEDTVTYDYDDIGRWTSVTPQGSEAIIHEYDNLNRLKFIKPGARTFAYAYPPTGPSPLPDSLTRPTGSFTTFQYDDLKRLRELVNKNSSQALINSDSFTYNAQDLRGSETVTNGAPITNFTANLTSYSYNNVNQLLSTLSPDRAFAHDADGNMTTGYTPEGYQYTAVYDGENRLKSIDYTDGESVPHRIDYHYSGNGFLAKQVVDGVETRIIRSGPTLLQEREGPNITRSYVWDPLAPGGIGGLLEMSQGGQRYSYLYDGKGNVSAVLDGTQEPVATYAYDEFGKLMVKGGTLNQPFGFSTKPYDEKTGLSYYGYRFYAPVLGRWVSRDPIGFNGGDLNLYGFVQNSPVNFIDSWGLIIQYCNRGAHGPLGWAGFNHGYLWDSETGDYYGMGGSEELGPDSDTCNDVPGSEGREGEILDDLRVRSSEPWLPWSNCHTAIDDVLNDNGLTNPGAPGGIWGPIPSK